MLGCQDGENLFIMQSDSLHRWESKSLLAAPRYEWELAKIGNCASPIETEKGWIVLIHGVEALRRYCIGALMLDRDDPSRVIGRLSEPLITPEEREREGYVPNVVYTCGVLKHQDVLVIPYACSDTYSAVITVDMHELLAALLPSM